MVTATSHSGMTHSHLVACDKPFLALNLIILHKANPETRRQISHQICSKLFSFYSKTSQRRCKSCWFLKGCWELTRTLKLPTLSSWGLQLKVGTGTHQENTQNRVIYRKRAFLFNSVQPHTVSVNMQWQGWNESGLWREDSGSEIRSMPKIGESESTWTAQAWTTKQGHKWESERWATNIEDNSRRTCLLLLSQFSHGEGENKPGL